MNRYSDFITVTRGKVLHNWFYISFLKTIFNYLPSHKPRCLVGCSTRTLYHRKFHDKFVKKLLNFKNSLSLLLLVKKINCI